MANCSFCGRSEDSVERLISGPEVFICDKCVRLCTGILDKKPVPLLQDLPKPITIKAHLDRFVIGQELAKKAISVAVYNHYKRVRSVSDGSTKNKDAYGKSNVLLLGPTGSGKTLLAKTLAAMLEVPFAIADATTLTEAGYVGEDVENVILRLLQAADFDVALAEIGIIYLDEVDKLHTTKSNVSITRDVSGEGVQQALLKIVEGTIANIPPRGGRKHPNQEFIKVNTENILFITGGAFVNLDRIVAKRLGKSTIGYGDDAVHFNEENNTSYLLSQVEPEDLIQYGMIPEFIGRFNNIVNCNALSKKDLVNIITVPEGAILGQYARLFEDDKIKLTVKQDAIEYVAEKAISVGTGARAIRTIFENILRDSMFESPSDETIEEIIVDRETIEKKINPKIIRRKSEAPADS